MPVRTVPLTDIHEAAYNPRLDLQPGDPRYERIQRSLKRFGLVSPLVWNERNGNLVGGHQRLKILRAEGASEVEVSVVSLDDADEKALNLVLNSPDIQGEFDADRLVTLLAEVESQTPDTYDELELALLGKLDLDVADAKREIDAERSGALGDEAPGPPAMELLPYEHYDYVVLMFKDSRDYIAALDHFGIQKASVPTFVGSKKIGLGRVIDGARYLDLIRKRLKLSTDHPTPESVAPAAEAEASTEAALPDEDRLPGDPIADMDQAFAEVGGKKRRGRH